MSEAAERDRKGIGGRTGGGPGEDSVSCVALLHNSRKVQAAPGMRARVTTRLTAGFRNGHPAGFRKERPGRPDHPARHS
ncbi:hypothetical protein GCM10011583_63030 [Streptomyces camponoticapitis]|uniref:Uncharacterized protein n=1 Tax=Streptomyces camponoticapitis TaxID=1616125 RepID=A0ABQ2ERP0_9ACTN|nr:hypothetical protein GCM10011583_63030 [Streptomyces camponoticapitis]